MVGGEAPGEQPPSRVLDLGDRLASDIGQDQRFIVDFGDRFLLDHLYHRRSRRLFELRVDGTEHRMRRHHDLVGGQRDQSAARHRIMRYEDADLRLVAADCAGDLQRREDEASGCVKDDVQRDVGAGHVDRAQHLFGVVDVDIAHDRKPEEFHRLLTVHEQDDS